MGFEWVHKVGFQSNLFHCPVHNLSLPFSCFTPVLQHTFSFKYGYAEQIRQHPALCLYVSELLHFVWDFQCMLFQTFVWWRLYRMVNSTLLSCSHHFPRGMYLAHHPEGSEINLWETVCFSSAPLWFVPRYYCCSNNKFITSVKQFSVLSNRHGENKYFSAS